jgi:hypothetical protein
VTVQLVLADERDNLFSHEFSARVDRSVMRAHKRIRASKFPMKSTQRSGLYDGITPDHQTESPEKVPNEPAKRFNKYI